MVSKYSLFYLTAFICFSAAASTSQVDKEAKINGVELETGKIESVRRYSAAYEKTYPYPLEAVRKAVTNFSEKCNNTHKSKRKLTDQNEECKYHLEDMVESKVIKDIGGNWKKEENEVERFILARQVYRRGSYQHYELVQIFEGKNSLNQRTLTIKQKMLDDKEAALYTSPAFKKDSQFIESLETITLTEVNPEETLLELNYEANTDHWLLNKELSVPQVFASIGQSITGEVRTIENELSPGKREVASRK